jgi:hypothetical protein
MRNILLLALIVFVFSGCSTLSVNHNYSYELDLSVYSDQGFFVTIGDFHGEYEPVCIERFYCSEGMVSESSSEKDDDVYHKTNKSFVTCDDELMIENLVESVKSKGANGIIKLEFSTYVVYRGGSPVTYKVVSGQGIKR